jgi:hypothetical protein
MKGSTETAEGQQVTTQTETSRNSHKEGALDSSPTARPSSGHTKRKRVSWSLVNFWLDLVMSIEFLGLVLVSTIIRFVFPAASAAAGWTLWGRGIDDWMSLQFALVAVLAFSILVHLMLHWSWVCGVFFGKLWKRPGKKLPEDGIRTIYGVGLMIVILNTMGLLIALAALMVRSSG